MIWLLPRGSTHFSVVKLMEQDEYDNEWRPLKTNMVMLYFDHDTCRYCRWLIGKWETSLCTRITVLQNPSELHGTHIHLWQDAIVILQRYSFAKSLWITWNPHTSLARCCRYPPKIQFYKIPLNYMEPTYIFGKMLSLSSKDIFLLVKESVSLGCSHKLV